MVELGLVNDWVIVDPDPAFAPVMLPEIVPIVQVKLLGAEAAKEMLVVEPLQIDEVLAVVITGTG